MPAPTEKWTFAVAKAEIKRALLYGAIAAVMTIALAFGAAAVVGDRIEEETNQQVTVVLQQAQETQQLICDILHGSDSPGIQRALERHCVAVTP